MVDAVQVIFFSVKELIPVAGQSKTLQGCGLSEILCRWSRGKSGDSEQGRLRRLREMQVTRLDPLRTLGNLRKEKKGERSYVHHNSLQGGGSGKRKILRSKGRDKVFPNHARPSVHMGESAPQSD